MGERPHRDHRRIESASSRQPRLSLATVATLWANSRSATSTRVDPGKGTRRMVVHTIRALGLCLIACLLGLPSAYAEVLRFTTTLSGAAQVPPTQSRGTGEGEFQYDTSTSQLTFAIVYQDLTGASIAGHIHGPADAN